MLAILTGRNNAKIAAHDAARVRNYELANLISFAHHSPAKMPAYKATGAKPEKVSDEADQARVRGLLIAMSLAAKAR